jgi:putative DNA-invertase from lambdoid prophage Rac
MYYGYVRVSTDKQTTENQKLAIEHFLDQKKINEPVKWVSETQSGQLSFHKRLLGELIEVLQAGDVLLVSELSRLGRSLFEVMELLGTLMKKEVQVMSIKEGFELGDNINSKVLAFAFSLSAEIERQLISQRTKEGLQRAKHEGKVLGRPVGSFRLNTTLQENDKEIHRLLDKKVSKSAVARVYNVSKNALLRYLNATKNRLE